MMDNNDYQRRAAEAAERTAIAAEQKEERARQIWRALKYGGLSGLSIFIIGMVDYVLLVSANNIFHNQSGRIEPLVAFLAIIISVVGLAITTARIGPKLDLRISGGLYGIAGGILGLFLIFLFVIMHDESEMWQSIPVWSLILAICIASIIISIIAIKPNQPSTTNIQEFGSVLTTGRGLVLDQFRSWFVSKPTPVGPDEILIAAPTGKRNVIRWVMTALGILYGLNFAISQSRTYEGYIVLSLLEKNIDKAEEFAEAGYIGNLTLIIALAIPLALWALVNQWKPITRKGYAFRFGLWPTVFLSSFFGGPIACSIMGMTQRVQTFYGAFQATLVLSVLGGATFIFAGYWIGNGIGSVQKKPVLNIANDLPRFAFNPNQKISTNANWNGRLKKFGIFLAVTVVCVVGAKYLGRQQAREAAFQNLEVETVLGKAPKSSVIKYLPKTDGFAPNVNTQIQPFEDGIDAYAKKSRNEFTDFGFKMLSESKPSKFEVIFEYSGDYNGLLLHCYAKAVQKGKTICLTTATATEGQWPKVAAELKACVDSFEPK